MKLSERESDQYHKQCALLAGFTICGNGEQLCIFSGMSNSLFLFSKTGENFKMFSYESERVKQDLYTGYCFADNSEIFLAPYNASSFLVFNIDKEKFFPIDIDVEIEIANCNHKFLKVIKQHKLLWIIGENIHKIVCIECKEGYQRRNVYDYDTDLFWTYNHLVKGKSIFLPCRNRDVMLEIDVLSEEVQEHRLQNGKGSGFSDIYCKDDKIILVGVNGEQYECNVALERISEIDDGSYKIPTWYSCDVNEKCFRLSAYTPELFINYRDGKCKKIELPVGNTSFGNGVCFQGIYKNDGGIYILSKNGRLFFVNITSESVEEVFLLCINEKNDVFQNMFNQYAENNVCQEGYLGSLENFISFVSNR